MQYVMNVFEDPENDEFRVIDRNGEPWFVLSEVCKKLDIVQPASASRMLDEDEKGVLSMHTPGGVQPVSIINESGLYSLILRSRKPEAKRFKKWVTSEVLPSIRKTGRYGGRVPAFIRRFNENWNRVSPGHFSVISELAIRFHGRLEMEGHLMADKAPDGTEIRPDVSVGRYFMQHLRDNHPKAAASVSKYRHKTPETECDANQFPVENLPLFIDFVDNVWIPEHGERYLKTRDPKALMYLPRLLPSPQPEPA